MILRNVRYFVGDFETTVYDGQQETEVWASALVEMYTEEAQVFHSIDETWEYLKQLKGNLRIYYHNLAFDGMFWLYFFMTKLKFDQAIYKSGSGDFDYSWIDDKDMQK